MDKKLTMFNKKTTQSNPSTPKKPTEAILQQAYTTVKESVSPISSFPTIEESVDEHDIGDEYPTDGYLTEKEQH
nr:hypothetical protein [Tanacetum cinerariifolium]